MGSLAIAFSAIAGLAVGWFLIARVVEEIPEPLPLDPRARVALTVVNGALWAVDAQKFTRWWVAIFYFVVFSTLVAVSVVDLRLYRIPDRIVFPALGASAVVMMVTAFAITHSASDAITVIKYGTVGMVAYFAILFVFHVISPRGMGFGDVKLALLMGLSLGWLAGSAFGAIYLVMIALFFGCILGIVFGLGVRVVTRRKGAFPFGPALAVGTIYVVMNFQQYLV